MQDRSLIGQMTGFFGQLPLGGRLGRRAGQAASSQPDFFGVLESRQLFANTALPTLAMLENANDAVIRLETSLGDVDVELFSSQAPITTANFLNYVNSGRYDNTFFHRSAQQEPSGTNVAAGQARPTGTPFALQGGGFSLDATDSGTQRLTQITNDNPIVLERTGRLNTLGTISMARTSSPNTATGQFFFNMTNNSFLDPSTSNDGYAVFGRVVQGWDVVQAIHNLTRYNLTNASLFAPATGGSDLRSAMSEVPTQNLNTGTGLTASNLVYIVNAEVVKSAGSMGYLQYQTVFADGQRSSTSVETLGLVNRNDGVAWYQVLARYENGDRESVVSSGVLNANASINIPISDFLNAGLNLVRQNVPYSLVVQSSVSASVSVPRGVEAAFNRRDFGADTAEAGSTSALFGVASGALAQYKQWTFPRIERNANSREFITWSNLASTSGTVHVQFYSDTGPFGSALSFSLAAYRRGGVEVHSLNLPAGIYGAVVTSDVPIAASLSDFDVTTGGPTAAGATPGWTVTGSPNTGAGDGALADVLVPSGSTVTFLSVLNSTGIASSITFDFTRADGTHTSRSLTLGGSNRADIDMAGLGLTPGEHVSARWTSPAAMAVQGTSIDTTARYQVGAPATDGASSMSSSVVGSSAFIALAGLTDPSRAGSSLFETVRVYNPFVNGATDGPFSVSVRYHFSDGTTVDSAALIPSAHGYVTFQTDQIAAVMTKINSGTQFQNYAISIIGSSNSGAVAGIAEYARLDTQLGRWVSATATASGTLFNLEDPRFVSTAG